MTRKFGLYAFLPALLALLIAACGPRTLHEIGDIEIVAPQTTIAAGEEVALTANVLQVVGTPDETVTWTSDDESVATVTAEGLVTGIAPGTATIEAVSNFDATASDSVEIEVVAFLASYPTVEDDLVVGTEMDSLELEIVGGAEPFAFELSDGSTLPAGVTLDPDTGALTGTPTEEGTFSGTVVVTDDDGETAEVPYEFTVVAAGETALAAEDYQAVTDAAVGAAMTVEADVAGGTPPYTYAVTSGALPPGVTLDPDTGTISGSPTTAGSYTGAVTVTDDAGAADTAAFSIQVADSATFEAGDFGVISEVEGEAMAVYYEFGGPYTYGPVVTGSDLPTGVTWDEADGGFEGTPAETGVFTGAVEITSDGATDTAPYVIVVSDFAFTYSNSDPTVTVDQALPPMTPVHPEIIGAPTGYSSEAYSTSVSDPIPFIGLPPGVTLDTTTGEISGSPNATGFYRDLIEVTTDTGDVAYALVEIEVVE